jgi:hypothetical protein
MNMGVDLHIAQLLKEGTIGTAWPRIHPHDHLPSVEWLDAVTDKGLQEVHARQPSSY